MSKRRVNLGVIEFHSDSWNPGLRQRFYDVTEDLRTASCIVDLWLMDIASVLREFGYDMRIYRMPKRQAKYERDLAELREGKQ
jgi:hypothetical protein